MKNHLIYFYSSADFYHTPNQIIGLDGSVDDLKLIEYGKVFCTQKNRARCLNLTKLKSFLNMSL